MNEKLKNKYVAIKLRDFNYYIWFATENVTEDQSNFKGLGGWGKGGAFTNIECKTTEIISWVYSSDLQYV